MFPASIASIAPEYPTLLSPRQPPFPLIKRHSATDPSLLSAGLQFQSDETGRGWLKTEVTTLARQHPKQSTNLNLQRRTVSLLSLLSPLKPSHPQQRLCTKATRPSPAQVSPQVGCFQLLDRSPIGPWPPARRSRRCVCVCVPRAVSTPLALDLPRKTPLWMLPCIPGPRDVPASLHPLAANCAKSPSLGRPAGCQERSTCPVLPAGLKCNRQPRPVTPVNASQPPKSQTHRLSLGFHPPSRRTLFDFPPASPTRAMVLSTS
jgi:hypothetical protein